MDIKEDPNMDIAHRFRKFGLPNWMVNYIERLNFVIDFEQYASSPPETESFLTEHLDSCDFYESAPSVAYKMDIKEDPNMDSAHRFRKFGLPNWMVNNIERLNFVTDFEQYACSPPETESFLTEHLDSCDFYESAPSVVVTNEPPEEKPQIPESKGFPESKSSPSLLVGASEQIASLSIVDNLKQEEFYSSPDTTPCATPEPSPAPRRRMSGQQDTVQTNPGRWFYLGDRK